MTTGESRQLYQNQRISHWDKIADRSSEIKTKGAYYHSWLAKVYQSIIPKHRKVLEFGCGRGDLLSALFPSEGVGVDFSEKMVAAGKSRHSQLTFIHADVLDVNLGDAVYDFVILSDLINDIWDVQTVFERIKEYIHPGSRIVINSFSHLWEMPLEIARRLELATPVLRQNWLTTDDINGLLRLSGFEVIRKWEEIIWPIETPFIANLVNKYIAKLWPFNIFTLAHFIVARPEPIIKESDCKESTVSVIVAARNESGNISNILDRVPTMGTGTELIFVEGGSTDDSYEKIENMIAQPTRLPCRLFKQPGKGKGDAVRVGFDNANGELLMILDADLTVLPEDLPRFYDAITKGKGEFINGVRLVYPMEDEAMRFFNLVGNKFFSLAFSWLLGQSVKDTLCGTKVIRRADYQSIKENRSYFGEFDPFGDFDLIFGAAKQNLKIVDLPVRYHTRTYGDTNISRWKHGLLLLRMVAFAARKIKFV